MDNSELGTGPSKEWQAFGEAHPDLAIDNDGRNDMDLFPDVIALRSAVNNGRNKTSKSLFSQAGLSSKVNLKDYAVPTEDGSEITLRSYRPARFDKKTPLPAYLFYHGGGMLFGTLNSEDFACATWADRTGFVVLHACYRHTPEFAYPTQHNDAWDAFEYIMNNAASVAIDHTRLAVGGISAGGSLAASVLYREVGLARENGRPVRVKGQLLVIPWLVHRDAYPFEEFAAREKTSIVQCADAPILTKERYDLFTDLLKIDDPKEPWMNVGTADDEKLVGMPRTAFMVNGWDMLRDEGFLFAATLERLGVPLKKHVFPGLPHAFRRWQDLPSSQRYDEVMVDCLRWCTEDAHRERVAEPWHLEQGEP